MIPENIPDNKDSKIPVLDTDDVFVTLSINSGHLEHLRKLIHEGTLLQTRVIGARPRQTGEYTPDEFIQMSRIVHDLYAAILSKFPDLEVAYLSESDGVRSSRIVQLQTGNIDIQTFSVNCFESDFSNMSVGRDTAVYGVKIECDAGVYTFEFRQSDDQVHEVRHLPHDLLRNRYDKKGIPFCFIEEGPNAVLCAAGNKLRKEGVDALLLAEKVTKYLA